MPRYLSPEWLAAAAAAVADEPRLRGLRVRDVVVLQQVVTATGGDDGDPAEPVVWHVVLGPDGLRWVVGRHPTPDVTFTCDAATAWSVQAGLESAQAAFMGGRLRVGGDVRVLIAHRDVLGDLDDALAPLRAETTRS
jgi:hypothetical protein